jgi:hypothetical protein
MRNYVCVYFLLNYSDLNCKRMGRFVFHEVFVCKNGRGTSQVPFYMLRTSICSNSTPMSLDPLDVGYRVQLGRTKF